MVSRFITAAAVIAATMSLTGAAMAGSSQSSTLPPLSAWSGTTGASYAVHDTSSRYSPSTAYTTTMSTIEADAHYGTGSISESYSTSEDSGFSGAPHSVAGLGYNESLRATSCPVNVHGATSGATVLGCYNVVKPVIVKPVPQTTYYRVVRPVIYVRYPVPMTAPCATRCCEPIVNTQSSRYGGYGPQGGYQAGYGGYAPARGPVCR